MDRPARAVPGRTLARRAGFPRLSRVDVEVRLKRTALVAVAIGAFVAGTAATGAVLTEQADAGVLLSDGAPMTVAAVSSTAFGWRDGIRPGQLVTAHSTTDSPGGWSLETLGSDGPHVSRERSWDAALTASSPLAYGGLLLASLALLFLRTHRRWVLPAASLALVLSSVPLAIAGRADSATASMALAALTPGLWLAGRIRRDRALELALALAVVAFVVLWTASFLGGWAEFSQLDTIRLLLVGGALGILLLDRVLTSRGLRGSVRPRLADVAAVLAFGAVVVFLILVASVPPVLLATGLVALVVLLPAARSFAGQRLGYALVADLSERAAADALEEERARIARELHDAPLQQLAGIIRRLEVRADASAEVRDLHAVAEQLRTVATDLRPPVLDDLGLGAGLEFLAEHATTDAVPVLTEITDASRQTFGDRPPPDVELALFRIAQEAVSNALAHAQASGVVITAQIERASVDLEIRDDGIGLRPDAARQAALGGHLGLANIRRRAQGVDAELSIDSGDHGTTINVRWHR